MSHQSPTVTLPVFLRVPQHPEIHSAPEAEWIYFDCATTKPHFGPVLRHPSSLGLLAGLVCL